MAKFVGISEGYEYQHNATKNRKSNTRNRGNSNSPLFFEQTSYVTHAFIYSLNLIRYYGKTTIRTDKFDKCTRIFTRSVVTPNKHVAVSRPNVSFPNNTTKLTTQCLPTVPFFRDIYKQTRPSSKIRGRVECLQVTVIIRRNGTKFDRISARP